MFDRIDTRKPSDEATTVELAAEIRELKKVVQKLTERIKEVEGQVGSVQRR